MREIVSRRSIRKYLDKPVENEKIMELLESARLAPSGSNTQPWHFIVIKSPAMREKVATVSHNQQWMRSAPVYIAVVGDIRCRIKDNPNLVLDENSPEPELKLVIRDTTIAAEHIILSAEALGLSTCWIAWFTQEEIRPVLKVPEDKYVLSIITVGYSAENPESRPRKSLEDIVHYENW